MAQAFVGERGERLWGGADTEVLVDWQPLHAKIWKLTLENDFLEDALTKVGLPSARQ